MTMKAPASSNDASLADDTTTIVVDDDDSSSDEDSCSDSSEASSDDSDSEDDEEDNNPNERRNQRRPISRIPPNLKTTNPTTPWWKTVRDSVQRRLSLTSVPTTTSSSSSTTTTMSEETKSSTAPAPVTTTTTTASFTNVADWQTFLPGTLTISWIPSTSYDDHELTTSSNLLLHTAIQNTLGLTLEEETVVEWAEEGGENHYYYGETKYEEEEDKVYQKNDDDYYNDDGTWNESESSSEETRMVQHLVVQHIDETSPILHVMRPLLQQRERQDGNNDDDDEGLHQHHRRATLILTAVNDESDGIRTMEEFAQKKSVAPFRSLTLTFRVQGGQVGLKQAIVVKPNPEASLGLALTNSKYQGQTLLTVHQIVSTGLLARSALATGDFILAANGQPCHDLVAHEVTAHLRQYRDVLSILALEPGPTLAQRWLGHARRASLAMGDSAMVGVGLVRRHVLPIFHQVVSDRPADGPKKDSKSTGTPKGAGRMWHFVGAAK